MFARQHINWSIFFFFTSTFACFTCTHSTLTKLTLFDCCFYKSSLCFHSFVVRSHSCSRFRSCSCSLTHWILLWVFFSLLMFVSILSISILFDYFYFILFLIFHVIFIASAIEIEVCEVEKNWNQNDLKQFCCLSFYEKKNGIKNVAFRLKRIEHWIREINAIL